MLFHRETLNRRTIHHRRSIILFQEYVVNLRIYLHGKFEYNLHLLETRIFYGKNVEPHVNDGSTTNGVSLLHELSQIETVCNLGDCLITSMSCFICSHCASYCFLVVLFMYLLY